MYSSSISILLDGRMWLWCLHSLTFRRMFNQIRTLWVPHIPTTWLTWCVQCNMLVYIIPTSCIISWDNMADHLLSLHNHIHLSQRHQTLDGESQATLPRCYRGASACCRAVAWWIFAFCCWVSWNSVLVERLMRWSSIPNVFQTLENMRKFLTATNSGVWVHYLKSACASRVIGWLDWGRKMAISSKAFQGSVHVPQIHVAHRSEWLLRFAGFWTSKFGINTIKYIQILSSRCFTIRGCSGNPFLAEEHGARFAAQLRVDLDLAILPEIQNRFVEWLHVSLC